ncbi:soluble lytic murein transglycosylase [uncultured Gammaproteobacteria bacterium]
MVFVTVMAAVLAMGVTGRADGKSWLRPTLSRITAGHNFNYDFWVSLINNRQPPAQSHSMAIEPGVERSSAMASEPESQPPAAIAGGAAVLDTESAVPGIDPAVVLDPSLHKVWLRTDEVARYRRIFELQDTGDWAAADHETESLTDDRLAGHVRMARYLQSESSPIAYEELVEWLKGHGDHGGVERVYALALRRQPHDAEPPPAPNEIERLTGDLETRAIWGKNETTGRVQDTPDPDAILVERIETFLRAGKPGAALEFMAKDRAVRQLDPDEYDTLRSRVAAALYYAGSPRSALTLALASAQRSGTRVPEALWIAGLASWRLGQPDQAARQFVALARVEGGAPWRTAAASLWAARALDKIGRPQAAAEFWTKASRYQRNFHGMIARRHLGLEANFHWRTPALTVRHVAALATNSNGWRALALLQIGRLEAAERELIRIHPRNDGLLAEALVALADGAGLPALALRLGNAVATASGRTYDAVLYPLPHWVPSDGFSIDRSLLFAIMRQESRFDTRTVSRAGATGLMQIMPDTATDIAGTTSAGIDRKRLFEPELNLSYGQRYVATLLATPEVGPNLVLLAAGYNAGPGTVNVWRRNELDGIDDPLLFIDSIPWRETREYVRKVLSNYWTYQSRLDQGTETLDALAAGRWPVYMPADSQRTQVANHGQN